MPGGKKEPRSKRQMRMAHATMRGADTGMPKSVAREFARGNHGKRMKRLPETSVKRTRSRGGRSR